MKHELIIRKPEELDALASKLLEAHAGKRVFAFLGSMGAGKTTFISRICRYLQIEDDVSSPTFALINEYYSEKMGAVYHFDLYRLKDEEELRNLGAEEYFYSGNYCFVEWPELAGQLLPENTVYVHIRETGTGTERSVSF